MILELCSIKKRFQNFHLKLETWYRSDTSKKIYDKFRLYYYYCFLLVPIFFIILTKAHFEISENAYFYTLSAIPQTLASLIALVGAFVIFKRDKLKTKRQDYLHNLYSFILKALDEANYATRDPYAKLLDLPDIIDSDLLFENTSKIMDEINQIPLDSRPNDYRKTIDRLNGHIEKIKEVDREVEQISIHFNKPATLGLIAIMSSIIMLPFGKITYPAISPSMNTISIWFINIITGFASFKLVALGIIIYFTLLSFIEVAILLDKILGLEYN